MFDMKTQKKSIMLKSLFQFYFYIASLGMLHSSWNLRILNTHNSIVSRIFVAINILNCAQRVKLNKKNST